MVSSFTWSSISYDGYTLSTETYYVNKFELYLRFLCFISNYKLLNIKRWSHSTVPWGELEVVVVVVEAKFESLGVCVRWPRQLFAGGSVICKGL